MEYYGTLGPACCKTEILKEMLENGMTGIRLNLSHKSLKESEAWIQNYFSAADTMHCSPEFMIDLMGPELRIGQLEEDIELRIGEKIVLGEEGIPVPKEIFLQLTSGQTVLLDDGKIQIEAREKVSEEAWTFEIVRGGTLTSKKSIALPGCQVESPTLTKQDIANLMQAKEYGVTDVMLPFVRGKKDLICLREALNEYDCSDIRIFAKIENLDGIRHLEELLDYCDYIVIARGDLGNAIPLPKLPCAQDYIADICRKNKKKFLVVTQMLNSMIQNPSPTRAEVSDIYQAIKQGASAVMLTGETAQGKYPAEAMKTLWETGKAAEEYLNRYKKSPAAV